MKTLYINISGENIQSTDEVIVVGKPTDDLAGKFYFELGNQILKGAVALSVKNKRELITEFLQQHKDVYEEKILPQLEHAKRLMLSNDLRGEVKVQLPQEYIQWLNYYGTADYSAIAKSLNEKGGIVTINLSRIYRNGIQLLINSIEPDDYGRLVVNDDAVEDDTEMVVAIRERLKNPMLPFIPYSEFVKDEKDGPTTKKQSTSTDSESASKTVQEEGNDKPVLIVTYKEPKETKDWYEYENVNDVEVYRDPLNYNSIFRGIFKKYPLKEKMSDEHDVLRLEYKTGNDEHGWDDRYAEVSVNGIQKGLQYKQTAAYKKECFKSNRDINHEYDYDDFCEEIKKKQSKYEEVDYVGYSRDKNIHLLVGLYHDNIENENPNGADVITNTGELLFRTNNGIIPMDVFPSGLILSGKINKAFNTVLNGVMDVKGNVLIPCQYDEHSLDEKRYYDEPEEIEPGIINFAYDLYINAYTGEKYVEVTNDHYVKAYDEDWEDCDVIYKKSGKVVLSHLDVNNIETWHESYLGGWSCVNRRNNYNNILLHEEKFIKLLEFEEVMCDFNKNIPFISENRIVSYRLTDGANTLIPPYFAFFNIRDYQGNIIRTIENPDYLIIKPYKYGKALALRMENEEPLTLIYLDLEGIEHEIPFDVEGIEYQNIYDSFFASENTIVVKNYGEDKLINLQGKVLLDEGESIEQLSDKYLKYYSNEKYLWGLIDNQGAKIFSPRYEDIDVLE